MSAPPHQWLPNDPQDLERMLAIDILMTQVAKSLREHDKHSRAAWEIEQATAAWRATVEYWTWLSHYGLCRESL
jgi:hypothetical protein